MSEYGGLTDTTFDRILIEILRDTTAEQLLTIPGIYEIVREEYNNDILSWWEREQEVD